MEAAMAEDMSCMVADQPEVEAAFTIILPRLARRGVEAMQLAVILRQQVAEWQLIRMYSNLITIIEAGEVRNNNPIHRAAQRGVTGTITTQVTKVAEEEVPSLITAVITPDHTPHLTQVVVSEVAADHLVVVALAEVAAEAVTLVVEVAVVTEVVNS